MNVIASAVRDYSTYFSTNNAQFAAQSRVADTGQNFYALFLTIGAFAGAISLVLLFSKIMIGDSKTKSESKKQILITILLIVAIAALGGVITAVFQFGQGFKF